MSVADITSLL